MDGRDGVPSSGSGPFYIHRGIHGSGAVSHSGLHFQSGFMPVTDANISGHSNVRDNNSLGSGSDFPVENSSAHFAHGLNMNIDSSSVPVEQVKKKRGRPRKYVPDDSSMALARTPLPSKPYVDGVTPTPKKRGRPAGSGRKQQLSAVGGWMKSSAGHAFTPHIIHAAAGEDVASKLISFSQQRSRAVCILSATGPISSVTLRHQPTSSSFNKVLYEGHFQIVCLTGSYLITESGGYRNRTGGLSVSLCSSDGNVIGGEIGGVLIADGPVKVVLSSFVYEGAQEKVAVDISTPKLEHSSQSKSDEISPNPSSSTGKLKVSRQNMRNPEMDIDLMRNMRNHEMDIDLMRG